MYNGDNEEERDVNNDNEEEEEDIFEIAGEFKKMVNSIKGQSASVIFCLVVNTKHLHSDHTRYIMVVKDTIRNNNYNTSREAEMKIESTCKWKCLANIYFILYLRSLLLLLAVVAQNRFDDSSSSLSFTPTGA